ncbi:hypothetical protein Bca52824_071343 [Brassica carinata]|uniref:Uncharacterized protein n=1 Tax=Brassica carinata TaxID=52824 RepID=A0A8X7QB35_BRACI|nr:hypothetical protein Bca52824_071343 [Brassica carinata]
MILLVFDGSGLDAGVDSHLHRTPDLQTDGGILPSLNHLKGGGGQTWGMERMERGREMWLEDDYPALVRLKPSNETTKTSRVLGLSIVETRRLMTSHAGANEE